MARRGGATARAKLHETDRSWMKYRRCELCDRPYAANNYRDRKTRIKRWYGVEICAYCRYNAIPQINRAIDLKVLKLRKRHVKDNSSNS